MAGAPLGNQNSRRGRVFRESLDKSLRNHDNPDYKPVGLDLVTFRLVQLAAEGSDMAAIKEIGDRVEGKSVQSIEAQVTEVPLEDFLNNLEEPNG